MFRSSPNPSLDPPIHSQFLLVYNTLPDSAKRALLEDHLIPLIDSLPSTSKRTLLSTAHALQARFTHLPPLSLPSKKAEIHVLLEELRLDSYRSPASSRGQEISEEIVDTLVDWLSDIWQTVYEVGVEFERGHECLLYCCEVLQQISVIVSGFTDVSVSTSILDRSGGIVKEFSYSNVDLLVDAFLWIWRDMLLRILADGRRSDLEAIPRMLRDIQSATREWETALDHLLVAGTKFSQFNGNERSMVEVYRDFDNDYFDSCGPVSDSKCCHHCSGSASHWPSSIHDQLPNLRTLISTLLFESFTLHPSLYLYIIIVSLSPSSRRSLIDHLQSTAPNSAPAATAALDIHAYDKDATSLIATLSAVRPVLRARDAPALQSAARFLMKAPACEHIHTACDLVERELRSCVNSIRRAVLRRGFKGMENAQGNALWGAVERCAVGSAQRTEAVRGWVDTIVTTGQPGTPQGPELDFAAWIIGYPPGFKPDDPDPDSFLFPTIDERHPDYEDLLEEWRPPLKERFEGWIRVAESLKSLIMKGGEKEGDGSGLGTDLMTRIAEEMVEQMPWIGQEDVVQVMIGRIQDKPTKRYICDALFALSEFVLDRKKLELQEKCWRKAEMSTKASKTAENSMQGAGGSNGAGSSHDEGPLSGAYNSTGEHSSTSTSRYTAKGKGKAKAAYPEVLSTEVETETTGAAQNDNVDTPAYSHSSTSEWGEDLASGSSLGHENKLDE